MKRLAVAVALVAVSIVVSPSTEAGRGTKAPMLQSIELKSASLGFAVALRRIFVTGDGGTTWRTLRSPTGSAIAGTQFLDRGHWWVAGSNGRRQVTIAQTSDAGRTWSSSVLPGRYPDGFGQISISFIDAQRGWVSVETVHSTNFAAADVYRTTDGGTTWERLASGPLSQITFTSRAQGWAVGDAANSSLYATQDGGATWSPQRIGLPGGPGERTVSLPTFFRGGVGVFAGTVLVGDRTALLPRVSIDGGQTWNGPGRLAGGGTPFSAVDADHWIAGTPAAVYATSDRGTSWQRIVPDVALRGLVQIDFPTTRVGWALRRWSSCRKFKRDCSDYTALLRTRDGGRHWRRVTFP